MQSAMTPGVLCDSRNLMCLKSVQRVATCVIISLCINLKISVTKQTKYNL
jgi:hypothetical protein